MLEASILVKKGDKPASLADFGGQKLFGIVNSEEEELKLRDSLNEYNKVIKGERIAYKHTLSIAHWDCKQNLALLDVKKGNTLQKFGYQTRDGTFLNSEETLFLIDQGILELNYEGLPLSLHEAYILIIPLLPSFEFYEVYAYLCRLGYVVKQYGKKLKLMENIVEDEKEVECDEQLVSSVEEENDKENHGEESLEPMASGYVKNLWSEVHGERPCLRPSEAKSMASVLTKLQVMELLRLKDIKYLKDSKPLRYKIDFDVYLSVKTKKSAVPRFRIVVCKYLDPPPTLYEIGCLTNESDGVNLKLAVVNDGTISFYGLFGVDIPSIITVG